MDNRHRCEEATMRVQRQRYRNTTRRNIGLWDRETSQKDELFHCGLNQCLFLPEREGEIAPRKLLYFLSFF